MLLSTSATKVIAKIIGLCILLLVLLNKTATHVFILEIGALFFCIVKWYCSMEFTKHHFEVSCKLKIDLNIQRSI